MMMDFVVMTLSFIVGTWVASGLAVALLFNSKVLKWYMKKVNDLTMEIIDDSFNIDDLQD